MAKAKISDAKPADAQEKVSWRERFAALGNLPAFFRLVWQVSPGLFLGNAALRLVRAAIPAATLYIGKLIIDQVVALSKTTATPETNYLWWLVAAEFGLAILSTALGRAVSLMDSLLGDLFANQTSVRIMEHAATLDLEQFEDATFYDKLERARRQTTGRTVFALRRVWPGSGTDFGGFSGGWSGSLQSVATAADSNRRNALLYR